MKRVSCFIITTIAILLFTNDIYARNIVIYTIDDFYKYTDESGLTLIIQNEVDLKGATILLPNNCVLYFKNGSLKNGIIEGKNTHIKAKKNHNIFRNCVICGRWIVKYACSTMFDVDMDAMMLFRNMSHLSRNLRLSDNRTYIIEAKGEEIEVETIVGIGNEKPHIEFHTIAPNVDGIKLSGNNVRIENIEISDDYDVRNDVIYGENHFTIGNTIAVNSPNGTVENLVIIDCDFYGGTSSSYIASSQVQNCSVQGCTFSGYMADHAIYCSMKAITFKIEDCEVKNVLHTKGLFKIRSSKDIKSFVIKGVKSHNLNGYMAIISLLETPTSKLSFDNITVTKDIGNNSVFYGFCISDETDELERGRYNATSLTVKNCHFGYGYDSNSIVYAGAGKSAHIKNIRYIKTIARESNFGGGCADRISVSHCNFSECCPDKGIAFQARELIINNSTLSGRHPEARDRLLLVNYFGDITEAISLKKVDVDMDLDYLIYMVKGIRIKMRIKGSDLKGIKKGITRNNNSMVDILTE